MPKGVQRPNKEKKKPKQPKAPATPANGPKPLQGKYR
jgi:hypothetical protein